MLEQEFKYFNENREQLSKKYPGKFVVIVGNEVVGNFDSEIDAYTYAIQHFQKGKFLIEKCIPASLGVAPTFNSRVIFS